MIDSGPAAGSPTATAPARQTTPSSAPPTPGAEVPFRQSLADRSLDQWRGLALVLVLLSHGFFVTGNVPGLGRAGVNLFFFISGILVFRSLSRGPQQVVAGARYFWIRRTKRLVPAKYFYLLCMALFLLVAWWPPVTPAFRQSFFRGLPSSFLYYRNYYHVPNPTTQENLAGHLWSLACEMQFYLLAPLIFFAGGRLHSRRVIVYGGCLALMLAGGLSVIGKAAYDPYTFQVAAWPMMLGFCAEFLRCSYPGHAGRFAKPLAWVGVVSFGALAWTVLTFHGSYGLHKKVVILAGTLLVAGCLGCYLGDIAPPGFLGNVFHFLGNRTYSIYLWQQPLTIGGLLPAAFHPWGSILAIPIGAVSFHFLELPFMSKFKKPPAQLK
jgi:peptidoglycan/LPS O-acetylase OafA/YrhL